jgi:hypothetical protein
MISGFKMPDQAYAMGRMRRSSTPPQRTLTSLLAIVSPCNPALIGAIGGESFGMEF